MTDVLEHLIAEARREARPRHACTNGHLWEMHGGRSCPLGWEDCSQPVFECARCEAVDYGEKGGPGLADCQRHCKHGFQPPPIVCTECGLDHPCGTWGPCAKGLEELEEIG